MKKMFVVCLITIGLVFVTNINAKDRVFVFSGYTDWTYSYMQNSVGTFDAFHFNPIFTVNFGDDLFATAEIEYEHGGDEIVVEYMYASWLVNDYLTFTGGKFLVPFGVYNDRLHPTWIIKMPGKPYSNNNVVPTGWADTGIMFSGAFGIGKNARLLYNFYIVNGFTEAVADAGKSTRDLRREKDARDTVNNDKSIGGRVGIVPFAGTEVGVSAYRGKYAGDLTIKLFGLDAEWHLEDYLEIRGEYNIVKEGITNGELSKVGYYIQLAYKLGILEVDALTPFEVVARYDGQDFDGDTSDMTRFSIGLNYYIGVTTAIRGVYNFNSEKVNPIDNNSFTIMYTMGF